jgi:hypothetical protein
MERRPGRVLIQPRDIETLTGFSGRTARSLAQKIKKYYNKAPNEFLTVHEFCSYMRLDEELVRKYMQ